MPTVSKTVELVVHVRCLHCRHKSLLRMKIWPILAHRQKRRCLIRIRTVPRHRALGNLSVAGNDVSKHIECRATVGSAVEGLVDPVGGGQADE